MTTLYSIVNILGVALGIAIAIRLHMAYADYAMIVINVNLLSVLIATELNEGPTGPNTKGN